MNLAEVEAQILYSNCSTSETILLLESASPDFICALFSKISYSMANSNGLWSLQVQESAFQLRNIPVD